MNETPDRHPDLPLTADTIRRSLNEQGYVVVPDVLDPARDLQPVLDDMAAVLDGFLPDTPFAERMLRLWSEGKGPPPQTFEISLPQDGIRPDTPLMLSPAIFALLTNERLLDAVETVVGPEITANPVQHVRVKMPEAIVPEERRDSLVGTVPWHQDNGVLVEDADISTILTVWIPLTESTVENGCLKVLPGSHRTGALFDHCPGGPGGLGIPDQCVPAGDPTPLPMKPGSVLFMTQSTVHGSLRNLSARDVRVSLDLRYQPAGQPSGRPAFDPAAFVARSRRDPASADTDFAEWRKRWEQLREELSDTTLPPFNRWNQDAPVCA